MYYALGYAWKLPEIYENFKSRNLKIDGYSLNQLYGDNHKKALCYKVFKCCLWIILNDVIDNDVEALILYQHKKHLYHFEEK